MSKNTNKIDGWLVIDKPLEMGSTTVVSKLKWALSPMKIGHAGTLDPLATGVLPIAFGHATKLIPFVMDGSKSYDFQVTWGQETETDDAAGNVIQSSLNRPSKDDIQSIIPAFIGDIQQVPPAYSALKIEGKRAYDLARSGRDVDLKPRTVHIEALNLLRCDQNTADFRVVCGKGTYVRSLGRDMGRLLGCFGYITQLRRIACGPFRIEEACDLSLFEDKQTNIPLLPIEKALNNLSCLDLPDEYIRRLSLGQRIALRDVREFLPTSVSEGMIFGLRQEGHLVGLIQVQRGVIQPYRIFKTDDKS